MTDSQTSDFIHEIRVGWGDCDPARIAYTGHLPGFALQAIDAWWEHQLDGDGWYQMELDRGTGTPFVHMSIDFRSPVTPRHRLACSVWPVALGQKSVTFRVEARQDGTLCFEGKFVCVFIEPSDFSAKPAPADYRAVIEPLLRPDLV
ncbi:acyl-CoA thioesterase [Phaeobacter inhibens]|uniref:acyl-CoA thioesterase n=1 Tax=Phaeobacter inhibens TaxID=221822 RepID=UPI0001632AF0|nr:acyl-CoA thioesterase [Phaeobacter inhibens]AFO93026.1 thioesterase-like protein [Phaeobacter inhibens DSM 17395]AUQ47727.1 thioesterase-like protein [Phaeobacter inhibens]AUQ60187.1 thioesterase-like protein [Phaeobacter inhibens]AUR09446.1 thioesterase-like protein [Phaeobacter inhibens]AUR13322.1 thioesterase-like protein [Phaeobacter inhibens]